MDESNYKDKLGSFHRAESVGHIEDAHAHPSSRSPLARRASSTSLSSSANDSLSTTNSSDNSFASQQEKLLQRLQSLKESKRALLAKKKTLSTSALPTFDIKPDKEPSSIRHSQTATSTLASPTIDRSPTDTLVGDSRSGATHILDHATSAYSPITHERKPRNTVGTANSVVEDILTEGKNYSKQAILVQAERGATNVISPNEVAMTHATLVGESNLASNELKSKFGDRPKRVEVRDNRSEGQDANLLASATSVSRSRINQMHPKRVDPHELGNVANADKHTSQENGQAAFSTNRPGHSGKDYESATGSGKQHITHSSITAKVTSARSAMPTAALTPTLGNNLGNTPSPNVTNGISPSSTATSSNTALKPSAVDSLPKKAAPTSNKALLEVIPIDSLHSSTSTRSPVFSRAAGMSRSSEFSASSPNLRSNIVHLEGVRSKTTEDDLGSSQSSFMTKLRQEKEAAKRVEQRLQELHKHKDKDEPNTKDKPSFSTYTFNYHPPSLDAVKRQIQQSRATAPSQSTTADHSDAIPGVMLRNNFVNTTIRMTYDDFIASQSNTLTPGSRPSTAPPNQAIASPLPTSRHSRSNDPLNIINLDQPSIYDYGQLPSGAQPTTQPLTQLSIQHQPLVVPTLSLETMETPILTSTPTTYSTGVSSSVVAMSTPASALPTLAALTPVPSPSPTFPSSTTHIASVSPEVAANSKSTPRESLTLVAPITKTVEMKGTAPATLTPSTSHIPTAQTPTITPTKSAAVVATIPYITTPAEPIEPIEPTAPTAPTAPIVPTAPTTLTTLTAPIVATVKLVETVQTKPTLMPVDITKSAKDKATVESVLRMWICKRRYKMGGKGTIQAMQYHKLQPVLGDENNQPSNGTSIMDFPTSLSPRFSPRDSTAATSLTSSLSSSASTQFSRESASHLQLLRQKMNQQRSLQPSHSSLSLPASPPSTTNNIAQLIISQALRIPISMTQQSLIVTAIRGWADRKLFKSVFCKNIVQQIKDVQAVLKELDQPSQQLADTDKILVAQLQNELNSKRQELNALFFDPSLPVRKAILSGKDKSKPLPSVDVLHSHTPVTALPTLPSLSARRLKSRVNLRPKKPSPAPSTALATTSTTVPGSAPPKSERATTTKISTKNLATVKSTSTVSPSRAATQPSVRGASNLTKLQKNKPKVPQKDLSQVKSVVAATSRAPPAQPPPKPPAKKKTASPLKRSQSAAVMPLGKSDSSVAVGTTVSGISSTSLMNTAPSLTTSSSGTKKKKLVPKRLDFIEEDSSEDSSATQPRPKASTKTNPTPKPTQIPVSSSQQSTQSTTQLSTQTTTALPSRIPVLKRASLTQKPFVLDESGATKQANQLPRKSSQLTSVKPSISSQSEPPISPNSPVPPDKLSLDALFHKVVEGDSSFLAHTPANDASSRVPRLTTTSEFFADYSPAHYEQYDSQLASLPPPKHSSISYVYCKPVP